MIIGHWFVHNWKVDEAWSSWMAVRSPICSTTSLFAAKWEKEMIMSKHKDTITNTNTAWSSWISHLFYNITKLLLLVCGGTSQLNQKNIMLRLVARFPLCSVRQPRDLPDVTDAADEQKNKKTKNKTNWTKKEQQKNKPKWHSQKNKSNKIHHQDKFSSWHLIYKKSYSW